MFKTTKIITVFYLLTIFFLFLYSYTQVDLSLTLSKISIYQTIEKFFQYIGYFQRPLSTIIFSILIALLFAFYAIFLRKAEKISIKQFWFIVISISLLLAFSYNAFSYDLFNYIFDAKIITHYHQNPYLHKALDYPGDPMLSFMRWTHRTYPYGPGWLLITVPLSFLGLQFFLPTFFIFKLLMAASYLGSVYLMSKIFRLISPKNELFGLILFALNPLVIIESLISAHNDIVMLFFSLLGFLLLINKKYVLAAFLLIFSISIKYSTVFLIPVFIMVYYLYWKREKIIWSKIFLLSSLFLIPPIILVTLRSNFQPWYLLLVMPSASFLARKFYVFIPIFVFPFFAVWEYAPYIYFGDYNPPVPDMMFWLTALGMIVSALFICLITGWKLLKSKN